MELFAAPYQVMLNNYHWNASASLVCQYFISRKMSCCMWNKENGWAITWHSIKCIQALLCRDQHRFSARQRSSKMKSWREFYVHLARGMINCSVDWWRGCGRLGRTQLERQVESLTIRNRWVGSQNQLDKLMLGWQVDWGALVARGTGLAANVHCFKCDRNGG